MVQGDLKASMESRQLGYSLFSSLFYQEPTREFFEALSASDEGDVLACYIKAKEAEGHTLESLATSVKCEFSALFLGMSASPVMTSESVYLSPSHCLMQEQRDEVLSVYRAAGMKVEDSFREPEDHIAVELSFMAFMCEACVCIEMGDEASLADNIETQAVFVRDHLLRWMPEFCSSVRKHKRVAFYAVVADLFEEFIGGEEEYFASLVY